jgi:hypothetical protein
MSIVVYQGSVILSGDIVEDDTSFKTADAVAHKGSFPGAVLLPLSPPSEGRWGYVDGAFVDLDAADTKAAQAAQVSRDNHAADEAAKIRLTRSSMLAASDWTQVVDAKVDQAAWAAYRQALRDITAQAGFPWDVQWPEMP